MTIKFSIILPTYKCEFIENAIDSVISQTYTNWELIVIDNNLNNHVLNVIENKKNKKIRYYKIKNHGIIGKSRNLGIKKSNFDWIAFLDSDDLWYKNKLFEVVNLIKLKNCDLIYHNMHTYSKNKSFFRKKLYNYTFQNEYPKLEDLIINGNDIIQSSVVLRKKILNKVGYISEKKNFVAWEDFDLWLRISKFYKNFFLINKCLGKYYISNNKNEKHKIFIENINEFEKKYKKEINKTKKKYKIKEIWWIVYARALYQYNIKKYKNAYQEIEKIKLKYNKSYLNMIYIKFKIILKKW